MRIRPLFPTSSAPLDEFLINIKEPLPTFSFSFVQNRSTPLQSQVFVSEVELGGEDGRDAGHFHPLDQHSGYKRENYRRTRWRQRGANQEENWTLRIVSDDWPRIEGIRPIQFLFPIHPTAPTHIATLHVAKQLEKYRLQNLRNTDCKT